MLFYQNVVVETGALVMFELGEQKVMGSIKQEIYPVMFNVLFPMVLQNDIPQLQN